MYRRGLRKLAPKTEQRVKAELLRLEDEQRNVKIAAADTDFLARIGFAVLLEIMKIANVGTRPSPGG